MSIPARTISLPAQWAQDAHTTIPTPPVAGVAYRLATMTAAEWAHGQGFDRIANSAQWNQLLWAMSGLLRSMEQHGIAPYSAQTVYPASGLCLGTDGLVHVAVQPSGPGTVGGAQPTTNAAFWRPFLPPTATTAEMQAGTGTALRSMSPELVRQGARAAIGEMLPDFTDLNTAIRSGFFTVATATNGPMPGQHTYHLIVNTGFVNWTYQYICHHHSNRLFFRRSEDSAGARIWRPWVEIVHAGSSQLVPVGTVIYTAANVVPSGFLRANGATVSRTTFAALFATIGTLYGPGDGTTTFRLPDLRGEFIRSWDDGRGVDTGRGIGTAQLDQMQQITGGLANLGPIATASPITGSGAFSVSASPGANAGVPTGGNHGQNVDFSLASSPGARVGAETRPRNIALLACVKY